MQMKLCVFIVLPQIVRAHHSLLFVWPAVNFLIRDSRMWSRKPAVVT